MESGIATNGSRDFSVSAAAVSSKASTSIVQLFQKWHQSKLYIGMNGKRHMYKLCS